MPTRLQLHIIAIILAICLAVTAVFGVLLTMEMAGVMPTSSCLVMGMQDGLCPMSALEHLASWNHLFAALPTLLLLLGALAGVTTFIAAKRDYQAAFRHRWRLYIARLDIRKLFDNLLVALRRGLVQPRLYDAVIV